MIISVEGRSRPPQLTVLPFRHLVSQAFLLMSNLDAYDLSWKGLRAQYLKSSKDVESLPNCSLQQRLGSIPATFSGEMAPVSRHSACQNISPYISPKHLLCCSVSP